MAKAIKQPKPDKTRTTIYISDTYLNKIKYLVYLEDTTITDIIDKALTQYFETWEKKHGPIPKK